MIKMSIFKKTNDDLIVDTFISDIHL